MEEEWYRGLGTVVARRTDPPHVRLRGEMDMSYEVGSLRERERERVCVCVRACVRVCSQLNYFLPILQSLSQLQDVSRGLSMATISRLTNTYKFVPVSQPPPPLSLSLSLSPITQVLGVPSSFTSVSSLFSLRSKPTLVTVLTNPSQRMQSECAMNRLRSGSGFSATFVPNSYLIHGI